jgi:hypothetical protein
MTLSVPKQGVGPARGDVDVAEIDPLGGATSRMLSWRTAAKRSWTGSVALFA